MGLLLVACGGSPAPAPTATEAAAPTVAPLVELRSITLTFGGAPIARLRADGRIESVGANPPGGPMSPGPVLKSDGTIQLTKGGRTARLAPGGDIYLTSPGRPEVLAGRIEGDRLWIADPPTRVHVEGARITFDDGVDDVGIIEGPVDAGLRRTALVMTAAAFLDHAAAP